MDIIHIRDERYGFRILDLGFFEPVSIPLLPPPHPLPYYKDKNSSVRSHSTRDAYAVVAYSGDRRGCKYPVHPGYEQCHEGDNL